MAAPLVTVLLVPAGADIFGKLICHAEHDDICHIALDMHDGWVIAEESVGCWARPAEFYSNPSIVRLTPKSTSAKDALVRSFLRGQVGTRYNYEQIALDAVDLTFRCRISSPGHRYVCSSLAAAAFQAGGLDLFPGKAVRTITPKDWHELAASKMAIV